MSEINHTKSVQKTPNLYWVANLFIFETLNFSVSLYIYMSHDKIFREHVVFVLVQVLLFIAEENT